MPRTAPLVLLASRILNTPLMITRDKLDQLLSVLGGRIGLDTTDIEPKLQYEPSEVRKVPNYRKDNDIGIVGINGSLVHKTAGFSGWSGLQSYSSIRDSFDEAMNNPDISTILLDINSPGGEVAGVFDLIDHIYFSRGKKPIYAVINESAYSAAYGIASAADKIYIPRTGGGGSIGVVLIHADKSGYFEKAGIKYTHIYAGDHKIDGSPHKPLSKSAADKAQSVVNNIYSLFVSTVARNNGLTEQEIIDTQADTYHGQDAVDMGLADAVLSYQEVIDKLKTKKGGIYIMPNRTATNPEQDPKLEEQIPDPMIEPPMEETKPEEAVDGNPIISLSQSDIDTAVTAERERCITILESCAAAQLSDHALDFICDGSSVDTAHKMIMAILAERTKAQAVVSTINPQTTGQSNPVVADAKRRAEAAKAGARR